ncbi:hypothetical protein [Stackebrandtia soli]|uniref:hypothetical protein n=1 Tax=Stackebrandtia soli TaxID=1892856 RepID=UPI0039EAE5BA
MSTVNSRRRRGRETERIVADAMRSDGWPNAEPVAAFAPGRDVTGVPGVAIEVKARSTTAIGAALRQAVRNAGKDVPVVVIRLNGTGPATVDDWPCVVPFAVLRRLLRDAGYGDPPPEPVAVARSRRWPVTGRCVTGEAA